MEKLIFISLLLLVLKCATGQRDSEPNVTSIAINCDSKQPLFNPKILKELTLNCQVPNKTYAEMLTELKISTLDHLSLNIEPSKHNGDLNSSLFQNLNVSKLIINYNFISSSKMDLIRLKSDVLYVLNEVKELEIRGVAVVKDPTVGKEGIGVKQCSRLETLKITSSDLRHVPFGWLKYCDSLTSLHLSELRQRNATKEIRRNILAEAGSLKKLEIHNCFMEELEDELAHLANLETLNVAHNQIHYALTTVTLPNLVVLDLSYNHIFSSGLLSLGVERQPKLRVLSVDFNTVLNLCDSLVYQTTVEDAAPLSQNPLNLHSLQKFSLRGTITPHMCFGNLNMSSLEYFDLSDSMISAINFRALPMSGARYLEVNVSGCPISHVSGYAFEEADYKQLHHEQLKISGLNVTLDCECDEYIWMAKASREGKLKLSGALCGNGRELWTVAEEKFRCSKYTCGECTCRTHWKDNSTDMECKSGDLTSIPKHPGLQRLFASSNLVENVTAADIPDSLIYLDLSKNHIARMSENASLTLFKVPERHVRFYGNPIICDCENEPFILALMDNFDRVDDYNILYCIDDGRLIRNVDPFELCFSSSKMFQTVLVSCIGAGIGIVALVVGLYYRFGKAVKVYLYSKGLCLFCIRESDVDADRKYDAFVSFSHSDEDFVMKNLLPGLEAEPYNYNVCIHYRNWVAGELIPVQIKQSIANSKRTIVVLSKSFLDSLWGLLEFRTAHLTSLKEGRTRLIIVILDDILETGNLDGELRTYLRTNTYVKWDDPWFWDKVRYALPHRSVNTEEIKVGESIPRTNEESNSRYESMEEGIDVKFVPKRNEDKRFKAHGSRHVDQMDENNEMEDNVANKNNDEDDTKDNIKEFNYLNPGFQHEQISTDSATEMETYT